MANLSWDELNILQNLTAGSSARKSQPQQRKRRPQPSQYARVFLDRWGDLSYEDAERFAMAWAGAGLEAAEAERWVWAGAQHNDAPLCAKLRAAGIPPDALRVRVRTSAFDEGVSWLQLARREHYTVERLRALAVRAGAVSE